MLVANKGMMTVGRRDEAAGWWFYVEARSSTVDISMSAGGSPPEVSLEYSTDDGKTWSPFDASGGTTVSLTGVGKRAYFRAGAAGNLRLSSGTTAYRGFEFRPYDPLCEVAVGGNIMSLLSQTETTEFPSVGSDGYYAFMYLFAGAWGLTDASALLLPADTLTNACYQYMFYGCKYLVHAPALPATTLAHSCYSNMFRGCESLVEAPDLNSTSLAISCYAYMFNGCTSLTKAPAISATTMLAQSCSYMFQGCTSLATAPSLPATTLAASCYRYMFGGCTALTKAPDLPATNLITLCYGNMFQGCTALTKAPDLPATTLKTSCYNYMFSGCSSLNSIKVSHTAWTASTTNNWVNGVAASGTFTCPSALPQTFGANNIPQGWSVVTT